MSIVNYSQIPRANFTYGNSDIIHNTVLDALIKETTDTINSNFLLRNPSASQTLTKHLNISEDNDDNLDNTENRIAKKKYVNYKIDILKTYVDTELGTNLSISKKFAQYSASTIRRGVGDDDVLLNRLIAPRLGNALATNSDVWILKRIYVNFNNSGAICTSHSVQLKIHYAYQGCSAVSGASYNDLYPSQANNNNMIARLASQYLSSEIIPYRSPISTTIDINVVLSPNSSDLRINVNSQSKSVMTGNVNTAPTFANWTHTFYNQGSQYVATFAPIKLNYVNASTFEILFHCPSMVNSPAFGNWISNITASVDIINSHTFYDVVDNLSNSGNVPGNMKIHNNDDCVYLSSA